ncbi:MAG TPA: hypothetical protein PLN31_20395 [Azoarcus taiwanensis]|nr:hypothetical protein [Azoarcus taiwanensis]
MSAAGAFSRANLRLFAHFGEEALLRGQPVQLVVSENVQLVGEHGEVVQVATTVTLRATDSGKVGDAVAFRSKSWVLDQQLRGDGFSTEFVVRPGT